MSTLRGLHTGTSILANNKTAVKMPKLSLGNMMSASVGKGAATAAQMQPPPAGNAANSKNAKEKDKDSKPLQASVARNKKSSWPNLKSPLTLTPSTLPRAISGASTMQIPTMAPISRVVAYNAKPSLPGRLGDLGKPATMTMTMTRTRASGGGVQNVAKINPKTGGKQVNQNNNNTIIMKPVIEFDKQLGGNSFIKQMPKGQKQTPQPPLGKVGQTAAGKIAAGAHATMQMSMKAMKNIAMPSMPQMPKRNMQISNNNNNRISTTSKPEPFNKPHQMSAKLTPMPPTNPKSVPKPFTNSFNQLNIARPILTKKTLEQRVKITDATATKANDTKMLKVLAKNNAINNNNNNNSNSNSNSNNISTHRPHNLNKFIIPDFDKKQLEIIKSNEKRATTNKADAKNVLAQKFELKEPSQPRNYHSITFDVNKPGDYRAQLLGIATKNHHIDMHEKKTCEIFPIGANIRKTVKGCEKEKDKDKDKVKEKVRMKVKTINATIKEGKDQQQHSRKEKARRTRTTYSWGLNEYKA